MSQVYNDYALGLREAARMLGVSERTLQRYVRGGALSCVKERQGNLEINRFSFAELQDFLRQKYLARVTGDNPGVEDDSEPVAPVTLRVVGPGGMVVLGADAEPVVADVVGDDEGRQSVTLVDDTPQFDPREWVHVSQHKDLLNKYEGAVMMIGQTRTRLDEHVKLLDMSQEEKDRLAREREARERDLLRLQVEKEMLQQEVARQGAWIAYLQERRWWKFWVPRPEGSPPAGVPAGSGQALAGAAGG